VASILKGFEWKMEKFLEDILRDYREIGMGQDNLIKLIFIFRDNHIKEMSDIEAEDAKFAVDNKERICETLKALKKFLIASKLIEYYREENRSFIPLYFIAYHIFHKKRPSESLSQIFDTYDTTNLDFKNLYKWIYMSLLNGLFGRGKGWIPYKTGMRKLLNTIKKHKNQVFPLGEIIQEYIFHPLTFFQNINDNNLNLLDESFLFYILYDREPSIRTQDVDHIQPTNKLESKFEPHMINRIENFQLLDSGTNRGLKRGKTLKEWITTEVDNKGLYLKRHLIPVDEECWEPENYELFLEKRRDLIINKINSVLNI
jgi:hypothetical protein